MTRKRYYWMGSRKAAAQDRFFIEALDKDIWRKGDAGKWDTCWQTGMASARVYKQLSQGKTVNHIPGNNALTVKSMLYDTLATTDAMLGDAALRERMAFFPKTYAMPEDYHALQAAALEKPGTKWIVKPKRESRGRGIHVVDDAGAVPSGAKWLAQEYLSLPHLYDGFKYVLRCYVAITSLDPLRVYLYKDGFVKLASEQYSDGDYGNLFAHLTNPDINEHNEASDTPVVFMSFDHYRDWLAGEGGDPDDVFGKIRDMAIICAIAAREQMRARLGASGGYAPGCYELIGLDCMLDADLKPWLLECNLSPSLDICTEPGNGGRYETETKRRLVHDLVSLVGLNEPEIPRLEADADAALIIDVAEKERSRAGRYELVYPASDAADFLPYFPVPRYRDMVLAEAMSAASLPDITLVPNHVEELIFEDSLSLFSSRVQKFHTLDPGDSFIWLKAAGGVTPGAIIDELVASLKASEMTCDDSDMDRMGAETALNAKVWNTMSEWSAMGLLTTAGGERPDNSEVDEGEASTWAGSETVLWTGKTVQLRWHSEEVGGRFAAILKPLKQAKTAADTSLDIVSGQGQYALIADGRLIRSSLSLRRVADAVRTYLIDEVAPDTSWHFAMIRQPDNKAALFASHAGGGWDALAMHYKILSGGDFSGAAAVFDFESRKVGALPAPARILETDMVAINVLDGAIEMGAGQAWGKGSVGRFIAAISDSNKDACKVSAIILPVWHKRADEAASLEVLSGPQALSALDAYRRRGSRDFSREGAQALQEICETALVCRLSYHDPKAAARELADWLNNASS